MNLEPNRGDRDRFRRLIALIGIVHGRIIVKVAQSRVVAILVREEASLELRRRPANGQPKAPPAPVPTCGGIRLGPDVEKFVLDQVEHRILQEAGPYGGVVVRAESAGPRRWRYYADVRGSSPETTLPA
jgi:hypothetical protein